MLINMHPIPLSQSHFLVYSYSNNQCLLITILLIMERKAKINVAILLFAVLLPYASVFAAYVCPSVAIMVGTRPVCPTDSQYNDTVMRCCKNEADTPGAQGTYCAVAPKLPGGATKCPTTHPFNATANMCCGQSPFSDFRILYYGGC